MPLEPQIKRAVSFIDGQNLYRHAKDAFGHYHPNYDPIKLTEAVCSACGWKRSGVRFYTGTPSADREPMWHGYWQRRLLAMRRAGIHVASRPIRYRNIDSHLPDGTTTTAVVGQEKGVDLRLGLDVVRLATHAELDVAVIFSQDQDLAEVAEEVRTISRATGRWLKVVSAYPSSGQATSRRGINRTDWFRIEQSVYDGCIDHRDYRPPRKKRKGFEPTLCGPHTVMSGGASALGAEASQPPPPIVARRGKPVARRVPCKRLGSRQPGVLKSKLTIPDCCCKPLPEDELRLLKGR